MASLCTPKSQFRPPPSVSRTPKVRLPGQWRRAGRYCSLQLLLFAGAEIWQANFPALRGKLSGTPPHGWATTGEGADAVHREQRLRGARRFFSVPPGMAGQGAAAPPRLPPAPAAAAATSAAPPPQQLRLLLFIIPVARLCSATGSPPGIWGSLGPWLSGSTCLGPSPSPWAHPGSCYSLRYHPLVGKEVSLFCLLF